MRENVRRLVSVLTETFDILEPIVEIGSFQVPEQIGFADMRVFFPNKTYVGCDMRPGVGVDKIENVHKLSFPSESVGTLLMLDTLEHVENPFIALDEIFRVLKPGGILLMTSVMFFKIHDYPSDYWRFTPQAFQLLLKNFELKLIGYQGEPLFPHTVLGIGAKTPAHPKKFQLFKEAAAEFVYI